MKRLDGGYSWARYRYIYRLDWHSPEAALAELEACLREGNPAVRPLRLTLPLLLYPLTLRIKNAFVDLRYWNTWLVGGVLFVPLFLVSAFVGLAALISEELFHTLQQRRARQGNITGG
jgi:hypothetical protein